MVRPLAVSLLLLGAIVPPAAHGQVPADSQLQGVMKALARLQPGQPVRVRGDGVWWEGPFARSSATTVYLMKDRVETGLPIAAVDSLWVRRSAAGKGAAIGAGVLGLAGGILFFLFGQAYCDGDAQCSPAAVGATGLALGAAGGALVGAVIGSATRKWHRRVP